MNKFLDKIVHVSAQSYRTEQRVDYVSKRAGNGHSYSVPVHWVEYIPVEEETDIVVADLGVDNEVKFREEGSNFNVIYGNGGIVSSRDLNVNIDNLKSLMKKD